MPKDFPRTRRVGEQIQRELATLIRDEVRDPRLGIISVSGVDVSRDLAHAKVFISTFGDHAEIEAAVQVLNGAAGFLRRLLGKSMSLRSVPAIHFHADHTLQHGAELSALIDTAISGINNNSDNEPDKND